MALFGGRAPKIDWGQVSAFIFDGPNGPRDVRARRAAESAAAQQTATADWLRAQLSPMDGPNGSGTGAMPSIEQQMAALQDAQLRSPEVAAQFAPVVQARRLEGMTGDRPVNERLAVMLNPEKAGEAFATQFRDDTLAPGSIRTRGGQTVAAAPVTQRFDDRFGTYDPATGQTSYSQPRSPTYGEETQRMNAGTSRYSAEQQAELGRDRLEFDRSNAGFALSPGQVRFGPDGQPIADNPASTANRPITEGQAKDGFNASRLASAGRIISDFEQRGFDAGASMITGGQFRGDYRQYESAAFEWADAMLRLTSGAQAPEHEVRAQMRTYFPQPGDNANVRAQKAQMRAAAEAAAIARAGPGMHNTQPDRSGPVSVSTPAQAQALPPGTRYRTPDGREFIR